MNGVIIFLPDFSAFQFVGCNNWIHVARLNFDRTKVNGRNTFRMNPKAPEHWRTPKRGRVCERDYSIGFWTEAVPRRFLLQPTALPLQRFGEQLGHMFWPEIR
jgi:hypothetical protein